MGICGKICLIKLINLKNKHLKAKTHESITNYQAHRRGKKHLKRQADFDKTGKYADDIQVALARGEIRDTIFIVSYTL